MQINVYNGKTLVAYGSVQPGPGGRPVFEPELRHRGLPNRVYLQN
jgi:hypothetical protein